MKKQLKRFGRILFFSGAILFLGCQAEDNSLHEEHSENTSGITIQQKNFKDFERLPQLTKNVYRNKERFQGKGGELDTLYNFVIDSSSVKAMTKGNDTYYTMSITRGETNPLFFENLVVTEEAEGNRAFLIKYYPDESYRQRHVFHEFAAFTGQVSTQEIDYETLVNKEGGNCIAVTFSYCGNGPVGTPAGPGCCNAADGGAHIRYETVTICGGSQTTIIADPEGGGNQGGGPSGPGTGSPSGSTGSGSSSGSGTSPGTSTPGNNTGGGGGTVPGEGNPNPGNPLDGSQNPGTGGGGSGTGGPKKPFITGPLYIQEAPRTVAYLYAYLSQPQKDWLTAHNGSAAANQIYSYTAANNYDSYSMTFVRQFIQSCIDTGLNLDFNKSLKSPLNVDMTAVSGTSPEEVKFNKIYEKLLLSPRFKNLFTNVFDKNDKVSVKFNIVDASVMQNNLGQTTHQMVNGKLQISVAINRQLLLSQGGFDYGSNIIIAKVIAHECLHAFIQDIRINSTQHPNIAIATLNGMTLSQAINDYFDIYDGNAEHEFIADKLIPQLKAMLNEILTELIPPNEITLYGNMQLINPAVGTNEIWNWDKFLNNISTQGLETTDYFQEIQENLSNLWLFYIYNLHSKAMSKNL